MVSVEEIDTADPMVVDDDEEQLMDLPSYERLLDAMSIERAAESIDRPTARLHLQALAKKLRRESEALKRMEKHAHMKEPAESSSPTASPQTSPSKPGPAAAPIVPPSSPPRPIPVAPASAGASSTAKHYVSIDRFAFDAGGYSGPFVTLYVTLPGVGKLPKDNIKCTYTKSSFDLVVHDLNGKSYRLFREHLEKDIDPDLCKLIIKSDEIRVKLHKVKEKDYGGYDMWTKLTEDPSKKKKTTSDSNPASGIMDLMKQMYDDGDDNMKRMIGETMMKQRTGELNKDMGLNENF